MLQHARSAWWAAKGPSFLLKALLSCFLSKTWNPGRLLVRRVVKQKETKTWYFENSQPLQRQRMGELRHGCWGKFRFSLSFLIKYDPYLVSKFWAFIWVLCAIIVELSCRMGRSFYFHLNFELWYLGGDKILSGNWSAKYHSRDQAWGVCGERKSEGILVFAAVYGCGKSTKIREESQGCCTKPGFATPV